MPDPAATFPKETFRAPGHPCPFGLQIDQFPFRDEFQRLHQPKKDRPGQKPVVGPRLRQLDRGGRGTIRGLQVQIRLLFRLQKTCGPLPLGPYEAPPGPKGALIVPELQFRTFWKVGPPLYSPRNAHLWRKSNTMKNQRRYDLDWLRVLVFGLLIIYHVGMFFVPWDWHVKNNVVQDWLIWPMIFLNQWRLPILFLISGMGTYYALGKRSWGKFTLERSLRLGLPLVVGMLL